MTTCADILERVKKIAIENIAAKSLEGTETEYESLLKDQLLHGKGSDGQDLTPGYLEDPYFKTQQAAQNYLEWKKKISPSVGRNPNAPNLYIDGTYHNSIDIRATVQGILSSSTIYFGVDIERKYNEKANILGGEYRENYISNTVSPAFYKNLRDSF